MVRAAPKGAGMKKRKALLKALAGAWTTAAQESGEDKPAAQRMAVYRVMKGTMTPKQVATELKTLAREGLVVVDGDGIRCGAEREVHAAATDDTAAAESVASVDGAGGARRVVKRGWEGAEGHDTSEMSDEIEEAHDGSTGNTCGDVCGVFACVCVCVCARVCVVVWLCGCGPPARACRAVAFPQSPHGVRGARAPPRAGRARLRALASSDLSRVIYG